MSLRQSSRHSALLYDSPTHHDSDRRTSTNTHQYSTSIRNGFLRKVYAIVFGQMTFIECCICFLVAYPLPKKWTDQQEILADVRKKIIWIIGVLTFTIALLIRLTGGARRVFPQNVLFLASFTLTLSIFLGIISSLYNTKVLMMVVGVTGAVCFVLTLCALQNIWDFVLWNQVLMCIVVVLLAFGSYSFHYLDLTLCYSSIASLLFSLYLTYSIQLMLGGSYKSTVSPEEYTFAALNVYLDVINVCIYTLTVILKFVKRCCSCD